VLVFLSRERCRDEVNDMHTKQRHGAKKVLGSGCQDALFLASEAIRVLYSRVNQASEPNLLCG
jgi:hypothetical protein